MSTGDYVRYLRAVKGGPTPHDIQEATGITAGMYRQLEQRYREVGDEEELTKLAEYFGVPAEDLIKRSPWTRKALSEVLVNARESQQSISIELRNGETIVGSVGWSDLGAALILSDDRREIVVQRHFIDRWQLVD
ncbi:MAG: helix-turn-helix transcriptional regulator [Anaerolineae bacterium]|nr:helix-turn-helix transcriptional regulator [Anaerolineae bacterium]MCB9131521.1 helix-turn-helix transcriptional regulator [Anaerolineales bacterium]MCB0235757.1 helix-turn-helix transcriptional regulator [Anaerolineae bacterium]MCB0239549.1 helix-turn-helix transcriptional regulator [Anaerolineae bacterium]MCB0246794.1 helix-turn-helix transcriptional regulator [Anaerolineae bacterium]